MTVSCLLFRFLNIVLLLRHEFWAQKHLGFAIKLLRGEENLIFFELKIILTYNRFKIKLFSWENYYQGHLITVLTFKSG